MTHASTRIASLAALALSLCACSGMTGGGNSALPTAANAPTAGTRGHRHRGSLRLTIRIPKKKGHHRQHGRGPKYVSPSTQSMSVAISGPTNVNESVGLTIGSGNCTSTLASMQCALTIPGLAPGTGYTATISTYDGPVESGSPTGNLLSTAQAVAFSITAGQSNAIGISLGGVPYKTVVTAVDPAYAQSNAGTYDLYGLGPHKFLVESLDADDNPIVGSGAPTYTFGTSSGLAVTVTPTSSGSNIFSIAPPATYAATTATFTITPTFSGQQTNGCAQTGANCSPVTVSADMRELLAIGNTLNSTVTLYADGATASAPAQIATISGLNAPLGLAMDTNGDLFVANGGSSSSGGSGNGSVQMFAPPYTGSPVTLSGTGYGPNSLAVDSTGNLFVLDPANILEYAPPYTGSPVSTLSGIGQTGAGQLLAVDSSNNLYAAWFNGQVAVYDAPIASGSASPTYTIAVAEAEAVAIHGSDLFAAGDNPAVIYEYALPIAGNNPTAAFTSNALATSTALLPIAVDTSGNVFASVCATYCSATGSVYEFRPPYTATPTASTTSGVSSNPGGLATDAAGNLFLSNCYGGPCGTPQMYSAPFSGTPTALTGNGGQTVSVFP